MQLNFKNTMNALPSFKEEDLKAIINAQLKKCDQTVVVLDDDPTGTQTMHSVPVLTVWDTESIEEEINNRSPLFYILTNTRSMNAEEADKLHREIGGNIAKAFGKYNREFILISRGDSTLRGHFPNDIIALADGLQIENFLTAVIPAFFEGGRYTIDDVHYVKEGEQLIPVAETSFAKDKAFGFSHSHLKEWVEEKSKGVIRSDNVVSFSLAELREESIEMLAKKIAVMPEFSTCIVNAAVYYDVEKFAAAYLQSGVQMFFRTAASFVKAVSGSEEKNLLGKNELTTANNKNGGLIIIGSYVPKSTSQLQALLHNESLTAIELDVTKIINNETNLTHDAGRMETFISTGKDVLIYTSRLLQAGANENESLLIGNQVSNYITGLLCRLKSVPRFFIAKGGITSSDIATKSLEIKRATVTGQALPGVPVWLAGVESKFPGLPYIIFPGNVGDENALKILYEKLK
ncbi:four-carbon acid sugar kinase family protein [Lacibacter sp.]|uniref:four-carbon acid sugar kinase family protein n=1 Tax=Lacibacter sp. TaxID=1915409 RepID=UPI002B4B3ECB|nr:four-carbon acid sugar kinase family protein [Lacibacter sp.]HLP37617.1 four-carbon acid sugar kinase family protein [Lacibacter sp.]